MEILLAMVVVSAVIFFGALISIGNERQRKAIDDLREQVVLWSLQDLKIKREQLALDMKVEDPLGWLSKITKNACGFTSELQLVDYFFATGTRLLFRRWIKKHGVFTAFSK